MPGRDRSVSRAARVVGSKRSTTSRITPSTSAWCAEFVGTVKPAKQALKAVPATSSRSDDSIGGGGVWFLFTPSPNPAPPPNALIAAPGPLAAAAATIPRKNPSAFPAASESPHVTAAAAVASAARAHRSPETPPSAARVAAIHSSTCFPPPCASRSAAAVSPAAVGAPVRPPCRFCRWPVSPLPLVLRPNVPPGAARSSSNAQWSRVRSLVTRSDTSSATAAAPPPAPSDAANAAASPSSTPPKTFSAALASLLDRAQAELRRSCMCGTRPVVSAACHRARCEAGHRESTGRATVCTSARACRSRALLMSKCAARETAAATASEG
mmetsp:Transcript_496/g.1921  ORF Transcript_496/g.1921 Transcript_496/m.1921 type:complete len:326 (-) Transcript_496:368-1345(-)